MNLASNYHYTFSFQQQCAISKIYLIRKITSFLVKILNSDDKGFYFTTIRLGTSLQDIISSDTKKVYGYFNIWVY